ncbi:GntR family transcriptional regulator [Leeia sp. TBRC 13508]|uniref:GntR family transcriptional regulator n=1 Tax=Leeia speluncae TaxID=2884804 RepID=A0ABS8DBK8_9NEIS|nr:GntR family transcriptional regulator [Leeia speluncae]MCB6185013.1 GntR family transcriptional regulator [Leeia speluncae]
MSEQETKAESSSKRHSGRYIYEELRKQILTLQLKPGTPLDEISLAEQFGLSRSPVRDALARLVSEGLVTILPNRTTLVTPFEIDEFPKYVAALDLLQRSVTRLAALERSDKDLKAINSAHDIYRKAVKSGDYQAMSETNKTLHLLIAKAGGNQYLTMHYERLLGEGQRLLHLHFDYLVKHSSDDELGGDHIDLIQAIEMKDADLAEKLAHEHTVLFQKRFLDYLRQNSTRDISV